MTISYPRQLPFIGPKLFASGSNLTLMRNDARNQTGAGALQVMELFDPLVNLKIVTKPIYIAQRSVWQAWELTLRGGMKLFWGFHPIRQYPAAYGIGVLTLTRNGGGAFDGTAKLTAITANGLSLSTLPPAYQAKIGDMVSVIRDNGYRSLHMIVEDATATAGVVDLNVEPAVPSDATINSTAVQLVRASCQMSIKHETFSAPDGDVLAPVSFEAVQVSP